MDRDINNWTIYMYTFPNGKRYIGATTRKTIHRQGSDWSKYKRCKLLYAAILEYGIRNIEQTILFEGMISNETAAELESYYIEKYRTNVNKYSNPTYGYNQTDGGEGTTKKHLSEERKAQLREQMRGFHEAKIGTHPTDESRKRMSDAHMGKARGVMTMEHRMRISRTNSSKPKVKPEKHTRGPKVAIIVHDQESGETLRFDSCGEAGYYFGVNGATICRWANGSRTPPAGYLVMKEADMAVNCNWEIRTVDIDQIKEVIA